MQGDGAIGIGGLPSAIPLKGLKTFRGAFKFNTIYLLTNETVEGYPCYASTDKQQHLYRHPEVDKWCLSNKPFNPADPAGGAAHIAAGKGPVPTDTRTWRVSKGKSKWVKAEVTVRELDAVETNAIRHTLAEAKQLAEAAATGAAVPQTSQLAQDLHEAWATTGATARSKSLRPGIEAAAANRLMSRETIESAVTTEPEAEGS